MRFAGFVAFVAFVVAAAAPVAAADPLARGDHAVAVDGVSLAYHVRGDGPTCIVYGGGPGIEWTYVAMPAVEKSLRLVYLEPAGTGKSAALGDPKRYTFARYVELLDGFRAALGIDKACMIGHSYGGFVVEQWAIAHADHVGKLVLYDTSPRSSTGEGIDEALDRYRGQTWYAAAIAAAQHEEDVTSDSDATATLRAFAPLFFADYTHHAAADRAAFASVHAYLEPMRGSVVNREKWDVRAKLAAVTAPTLVVVGALDWITPPARAAEIVAAISGAKLVTLAHSGHMGHVEEPAAFADAVVAFVTH